MRFKRIVGWVAVIAELAVTAVYSELVRELRRHDPSWLVSCVDANPPLTSWTCWQILKHDGLTAQQVEQLNRSAGVLRPVSLKAPEMAQELLSLWLALGVDVNAVDQGSKGGWTALHIMVSDGDVRRVQLLLKHGARADLSNQQGMNGLAYARLMQQKYPNEPARTDIVRLLEGQRALSQ